MAASQANSSTVRGKKRTSGPVNLVPAWRRLEGDLHLLVSSFSPVLAAFLAAVLDVSGRWVQRLLPGGKKS